MPPRHVESVKRGRLRHDPVVAISFSVFALWLLVVVLSFYTGSHWETGRNIWRARWETGHSWIAVMLLAPIPLFATGLCLKMQKSLYRMCILIVVLIAGVVALWLMSCWRQVSFATNIGVPEPTVGHAFDTSVILGNGSVSIDARWYAPRTPPGATPFPNYIQVDAAPLTPDFPQYWRRDASLFRNLFVHDWFRCAGIQMATFASERQGRGGTVIMRTRAIQLIFPIWLLLLPCLIPPALHLRRALRQRKRRRLGLCLHCGYDLRTQREGAALSCPECGTAVAPLPTAVAAGPVGA